MIAPGLFVAGLVLFAVGLALDDATYGLAPRAAAGLTGFGLGLMVTSAILHG